MADMGTRNRDEVYLNFIGGQWRQGLSPDWDENRNPARPSEILGKATRSTPNDVAKAIECAQKAQRDWAARPRPARAAFLERLGQVMKARTEQFAKTITLEEGKCLSESRAEVQKAIGALEFLAAEGRRPVGQVIPSEHPSTMIYTTRAPLGVVGVITPWSLPLAAAVFKIAPAILEGNAVVFKPSTLTPATAKLLVFTLEEIGLPAGVVNLVFGPGSVVGAALAGDSRVRAVSFMGSNEVGREVYLNAGKHLAKVHLELAAKNAVIVCADADLDQAAEAVASSAFASAGQLCTATSRVLVERSVREAFMEKLLSRVRTIRVGEGIANPTAMGPIIEMKQYKAILKAIEDAKAEGARLVCGGEPCTAPGGGHFVTPTVFDEVKPEMRVAREELMGPVLSVLTVDDFERAIEIANGIEYGLAAAVYTRDLRKVMQSASRLEIGTLSVNLPTTTAEAQAPFGGVKSSGVGSRELGTQCADFYCEIKTTYVDYGDATPQPTLL